MSDSSADLFSKADALLLRWRGSSPLKPPEEYPILTEVIGSAEPERSVHVATGIRDIEARVLRDVLQAIEPRLAAIFTGGEQGRLEDAVKRLAAELAGQMSNDISGLVQEAVRQALERELARVRAESTGMDP